MFFIRITFTILFFALCFQPKALSQLPVCKDSFPVSLLINNSFETYSGCNDTYGDALEGGYIDASHQYGGVTLQGWHSFLQQREVSYYNYNCKSANPLSVFDTTAFFTQYPSYPAVHLPLPDSTGFIQLAINQTNPNYVESKVPKPYITQCLSQPLYAGQPYLFTFYFGFGKIKSNISNQPIESPDPVRIGIFGRQDCPDYPLRPDADSLDGCLLNHAGWIQLGTIEIRGKYGWQQEVIEFTPQQNINCIGVGFDCTLTSDVYNKQGMYYMDKFILAPISDFSYKTITASEGNACTGGFVLKAPTYPNAVYSWYKDGNLIPGAGLQSYKVPDEKNAEGRYVANISLPYYTCVNTLPFTVTFSDLDKFSLGKDTAICAPAQITLNAYWQSVTKYLWQDGSIKQSYKVTNSGIYSVQVEDVNGCIKKDLINIIVQGCNECKLFMPSAFTPNHDGLNDVFKALPGCVNIGLHNFAMRIYNKWGQLVFMSNDINKGWDGMYKNKLAGLDTYIYEVSYSFNQQQPLLQKGTIILLQ